jgi:hypothetical protein
MFMLGCFAVRCAGGASTGSARRWNARGIPGLLFASSATAFWMLPVALDAGVLHPAVAVAKTASVLGAGILAGLSWRPAGIVIQGFFALNWCWMGFFAGLMYRQAPRQLCSVYLATDQSEAGLLLIFWAGAALVFWFWSVARSLGRDG